MKFKIEATQLACALAQIKRASGKDEILQHCLLNIDSGVASLTATDLTMQLSTTCDADGLCENLLLPMAKLERCAKAHSGPINFEVKNSATSAIVGKSKYKIANLDNADFPEKPAFDQRDTVEIESYLLACMIDDTGYAMAEKDARFVLNGLHIKVGDGEIRVEAADGHRIAVSRQLLDSDAEFEAIIPRVAVPELRRMLDEIEGAAVLSYDDQQLSCRAGNREIVTSLISGSYIDVQKAIITDEAELATVSRQALLEAANRAVVFANKTYKTARLTIADGQMQVETANEIRESATEVVDCEGGAIDGFGVNLNYLFQALGSIDGDQVTLAFHKRQMHVKPVDRPGVINVITEMVL